MIAIRLYGPGQPASGRLTSLMVESYGLLVNHKMIVHWNQLQVLPGGFGHRQLQILWQDEVGPWVAVPAHDEALNEMLSQIDVKQLPALARWRPTVKKDVLTWKWGIGAIVIVLVAVLFMVVTQRLHP